MRYSLFIVLTCLLDKIKFYDILIEIRVTILVCNPGLH
uniref:Uncharacterized protein n=1 Tax=Arundo donax TaxID=35708 RepID=A0A0A9BVS9_ARUDO